MKEILKEIAHRLIHDDFIIVLNTPKGFPYCPVKLIGMLRYLRDIYPLLCQNDLLEKLTDILEGTPIDPARKTMITIAIDQVFSTTGHLTGDSSLSLSSGRTRVHLRLLTESLDTIIDHLETRHHSHHRIQLSRKC